MRPGVLAGVVVACALGAPSIAGCFLLSLDGFAAGDAGVDGYADSRRVPVESSGSDATRPPPTEAGPEGGEASASIRCMNSQPPTTVDDLCDPLTQECCAREPLDDVTLFCTPKGGCSAANETEIRCDQGAQCAGGTCWLCRSRAGYLAGTACELGVFCTGSVPPVPICVPDAGACDGGGRCLPIDGGLVGFPADWFYACQ